MDRGSRRRLLALCALLLMSAIQAVTPDARDLASSALLKLFTLPIQPAHPIFNERDRSEEVCREVQAAAARERSLEADCKGAGVAAVGRPPLPSLDVWPGLVSNATGQTGSARVLLLALCRLIC